MHSVLIFPKFVTVFSFIVIYFFTFATVVKKVLVTHHKYRTIHNIIIQREMSSTIFVLLEVLVGIISISLLIINIGVILLSVL